MELLFQFVALDNIYIPTGRIGGFTCICSTCGEMKGADRLSRSLNMFSFHVDRTHTKELETEKMGASAFGGTFCSLK